MNKLMLVFALALLGACSVTPTPQTVTLNDVPALQPEQIRALSADQIEALGTQANQNLETFTKELRLQGAIRWPDYSDTLFVAVSVNYETYLSSYYRQTNGPDWTDDGCSGPTPPVIFDATACRQHDFGYRNVPKYGAGRNESVRKAVDERFLSNMYLRCDRRWTKWYQAPLKVACKADALIFYGAVRNFGEDAYYDTPQTF
jgi:Prokaryotic phospholipase A2/ALTTAQ repeat